MFLFRGRKHSLSGSLSSWLFERMERDAAAEEIGALGLLPHGGRIDAQVPGVLTALVGRLEAVHQRPAQQGAPLPPRPR